MVSAPLPPPRWVSLDCYGTLVDWESGVRRSFRELARVSPDEEEDLFQTWERIQWNKIHGPYLAYAEILQQSFREALEQFGYRCPGYAGDAFVDSLARWEPFAGVNAALIDLSQRHRLAIISNVDRRLLGGTLRHFSVRFDALVTAEDVRAYKPDPAVFRYALERLACQPGEVVHVAFGADYDLRPAAAVGLRGVYLNRRGLPRPEVPLEGEITRLEELPRLWQTGRRPPGVE